MSKMAMNHNAHGEMDMGDMNHKSHTDMNMSQMHHHSDKQQSSMSVTNQHKPQAVQGWANASTPVGHKALQYTDLKALTPQPDTRAAERELVIRLGGTMERYIWTIDGKKFSDKDFEPLKVQYGERIRLKFVNESMMAHPMHLHGMFMQLENGQSAADMPNKHTVIVPPGKTVTALLTADELGEWAIHCHLLYHMSAGMMSKLIVANVNEAKTATQPTSTPVQPSTGESHAHH
jgi:FtsP/CotA-like multicopper oxidase with cupredoxin domain